MSPSPKLTTRLAQHGDLTVVTVTGILDHTTAVQLGGRLDGLINLGRHRLIVDAFGVEHCDPSGLGVLVRAVRLLRDSGHRLHLAAPSESLARLLNVSGLTTAFTLHADLASALATLADDEGGKGP
ncbi:STAS domain-containing protein [Longispora sp. NPDC051575]|uniref:STAS domain-containing protein n=1 Tax=Longispora sp. NPDC051575 TaxID=3154943 RepID=UPI003438A56D